MGRFRMPRPGRSAFALRVILITAITWVAVLPSSPPASATGKVGWAVRCAFVRNRADDPIVYPGRPGASHLHSFFGNTTTAANSTYRSMQAGGTSCGLADDKAGYWIPAVYNGSNLVTPSFGSFYYRARVTPSTVKPFPAGLEMIAGSSTATGPQPGHVMYWTCENGGPGAQTSRPVNCGSGFVSIQIKFPDCWDGTHLDSADHRSHMAYSVDPDNDGRFTCPTGHRVAVPRLELSIDFPIHDGTRLKLSSGQYFTMHADYFNTWNQRKLTSLVTDCIDRSVNCGVFGLGH
jgi:Domain of unknown function (DUF1996)